MPRKKTAPADFPQAVLRQIELLAQNIAIARRRRGESQAQWAKKLGVSQPTMARIERGDPSVAMASYVMCIWLIDPAADLADLIAPVNDHAALEKEVARVRVKQKPVKQPRSAQLRTAEKRSGDAPADKARTPAGSDLAKLKVDLMPDIRRSLASKTELSELARRITDPLADMHKSFASKAGLSDLARSVRDPVDDFRKSLGSASGGLDAAKGIAALIAKSDQPKK